MSENTASGYIDIEKLTAEEFNPYAHANSLVLSTNNPTDQTIDLTTPLSKALFDLQEIDSNIHTLTSKDALEILTYTSTQNAAAARILSKVEEERVRLNASYARLEKEIASQYEQALKAKLHAERSQQLLRLGRDIQKVLAAARQFEALLRDSGLTAPQNVTPATRNTVKREDHRMILDASYKILDFRDLMSNRNTGDLAKINLVREVRGRVFEDGEATVLEYARRAVREFVVRSLMTAAGSTFQEAEETKARLTSATHILYLLSPAPRVDGRRLAKADFDSEYLVRALQSYLQTAVTSSSAGIARALTQLPTLDRALSETSARCQNVIALEALLRTIHPPKHPLLDYTTDAPPTGRKDSVGNDDDDDDEDDIVDSEEKDDTLLDLLLESLDTSSLPSLFWRSLASQLSARVQETLTRSSSTARALRSRVSEIRAQIRECVLEGSKMPNSIVTPGSGKSGGKEQIVGNWEREAAVMIGSVIGPINR